MSKLYFFRHAQASYGAANYDQLSPKGEKQSSILGDYLVRKKMNFDKIFVGPLERQKHTYELVAEKYAQAGMTIPQPVYLPELKEHEGTEGTKEAMPELIRTVPHIRKLYDDIAENPKLRKRNTLLAFQYFLDEWVIGNIKVEGIEPWADFRRNVKSGLEQILNQTGRGETIGIFTSGGTISSITAEALFLKDERRVAAMNFSIRNTSFTTFLTSGKQFNLLSFNEIPHLEEDMITFV